MKNSNHHRAATLVFALLSFTFLTAATLSGTVVRVSDGDTIVVLDSAKKQQKIRLLGIDAPEKKQAYGEASRKHLADLIAGKQVAVEWYKLDRYHRTLGKVVVDGKDVNLEQVMAGYAWHYKQFERDQAATDRAAYAKAEREAQQNRRGLWQESNATPPWNWRKHTVGAR